MSIFEETKQALHFDPFAPGPDTSFKDWGDLIPAPSLPELVEELAERGGLDITREWQIASAEWTMRYIAARDDTASMPKIDIEEEDDK